jgi:hypothetical protein
MTNDAMWDSAMACELGLMPVSTHTLSQVVRLGVVVRKR